MLEIQSLTQLQALKGKALLYVYGTNCGPCRLTAPIVETFANRNVTGSSSVTVVKVNAEEHPEVPTNYAIRSLPSLVLLQNGVFDDLHVGSFDEKQLTAFVGG